LVELVIVLVVSAILFITTPILIFHGVKTLVFLPKALAVNDTATEVLHQIVEGGFSTLPGQTGVPGVRFARRIGTEPAIWDSQTTRLGYRTSPTQCVVIELVGGVVKRRVGELAVAGDPCVDPVTPAEDLPYHVAGSVQITATGDLFTYYNPGGGIRRVDIAFTAQTGSGNFDEGEAREDVASSVAIRVP